MLTTKMLVMLGAPALSFAFTFARVPATLVRRHELSWRRSPVVMPSTAEDELTTEAAPIVLPSNDNSPELLAIRHTAANVMAMAVQEVFPGTQVTIGPEWTVDGNGFYCDFRRVDSLKITDADLKPIKKAADRIIKKKLPVTVERVPRDEARRRIEALDEPLKLELLDEMMAGDETISICHIGDAWWNICTGPQLETTGGLAQNAIKLAQVRRLCHLYRVRHLPEVPCRGL